MAASPWWVVWYEPLGSRTPGTANSLYLIIQAAKKSDITASSVGGAAITSIDGPFATKAEAQKDAGKGPVPGRGHKTNVQASGGADVHLKLPNPLSWTQAVGRFFAALGDWHLWASVGWIVGGIVLMLVGLRLWIGKLTPQGTPGPLGLI